MSEIFLESGSLHWKYEVKVSGNPFYIDFSIVDVAEEDREKLLPLIDEIKTNTEDITREACRLLGVPILVVK